jgi:tetratricopeptide (TPR) repeat protein
MALMKSSCIICYEAIEYDESEISSNPIISNKAVVCPNNHFAHVECIKDWMLESMSCPVCSELFDIRIVNFFSEYKATVEEQKKQNEALRIEEEKRRIEAAKRWDPEMEKEFANVLALEEQNNFAEAVKVLWDIHDKYAPNPKHKGHKDILLELGRCYLLNKQYSLANNQLMKLIKLDFNFPLGFYYLGITYEMMKMGDKAIWAYERALRNTENINKDENERQADYSEIIQDIKNRMESLKTK